MKEIKWTFYIYMSFICIYFTQGNAVCFEDYILNKILIRIQKPRIQKLCVIMLFELCCNSNFLN